MDRLLIAFLISTHMQCVWVCPCRYVKKKKNMKKKNMKMKKEEEQDEEEEKRKEEAEEGGGNKRNRNELKCNQGCVTCMLTFRNYILIYKSIKKISNEKNTQNINRAKEKMKLPMRGKNCKP